MEQLSGGDNSIRCPFCRADAFYRYGRNDQGRQRYLCLACNRQFIPEARRTVVEARPNCPECGKKMYLYRRSTTVWRFRCSGYPCCRNYLKMKPEEIR